MQGGGSNTPLWLLFFCMFKHPPLTPFFCLYVQTPPFDSFFLFVCSNTPLWLLFFVCLFVQTPPLTPVFCLFIQAPPFDSCFLFVCSNTPLWLLLFCFFVCLLACLLVREVGHVWGYPYPVSGKLTEFFSEDEKQQLLESPPPCSATFLGIPGLHATVKHLPRNIPAYATWNMALWEHAWLAKS